MRARRLVVVALLPLVVAGCGVGGELGRGEVVPLAKVDSWRAGLDPSLGRFAMVEIAYDRDTALRAWEENVPDGLRRQRTPPVHRGLYGDLDDVDFDTQVVVVWSSGESSTCPGWLADVDVQADGGVWVRPGSTAGRGDECRADYQPYRMLVAVDRDRVPDPEHLPMTDVQGLPAAGGYVAEYPAADGDAS